MFNRFTALFISIATVLALPALVFGATTSINLAQTKSATLALSPQANSISVGTIFPVSILLDTKGNAVQGVDIIYLNYNPALLEVQDDDAIAPDVQIAKGSLIPNTILNAADAVVGKISFSQTADSGAPFTGSGALATVRFKALAAGIAPVAFDFTAGNTADTNVASAGEDILTAVTNGTYTIGTGNIDTVSPVRSGGSPAEVLAAGTSSATLSLATNENATCRFATVPGVSYNAMSGNFSTTGGISHATVISGLANNTSYSYYIRCIDNSNNFNTDDFVISFSVAASPSTSANTNTGSNNFTIYQLTDTAPPGSPSALKAILSDSQIALSWINPKDSDFVRTRVLRKAGGYPASQTDGTILYEGTAQIFTDTNLKNDVTYYYALYSYDAVPNFSAPAQISAVPQKTTAIPTRQIVSQPSGQVQSPYLPAGINEGDLVRGPDGIKVYIVNHYGYRRHIFNPAIFNMYGHFKWNQIRSVDQSTLDSLKTSDFYRADGDAKVFSLKEIDENKGKAQKRWMNFSGDKFTQLGYKWEQVFIINSKERDYYQEGIALTEAELTAGNSQPVVTTPVQTQQPTQAPTRTQNQQTTTTQIPVPTPVQPTQTATNVSWSKIGPGSLVKSPNNQTIYYITGVNFKKPIINADVFNSYGNKWENIKTIPQDQLDGYPTVNAIRLTGSTKVYLLENNAKRLIKTSTAFQRLKIDWNKVAQVNQTELDAYPEGSAVE